MVFSSCAKEQSRMLESAHKRFRHSLVSLGIMSPLAHATSPPFPYRKLPRTSLFLILFLVLPLEMVFSSCAQEQSHMLESAHKRFRHSLV